MSGEELERRSGPSPARSTKVIPGVILEIWTNLCLGVQTSLEKTAMRKVHVTLS